MADTWQGIVTTLAPKYMKEVVDRTIRGNLMLALLEKRGRIMTNYASSYEERFRVKRKLPPVRTYDDASELTFNRYDLYVEGSRDVRGYEATDKMTEKEKAMLGNGQYAIVNRYKTVMPGLAKAVRDVIALSAYNDGTAAAYSSAFHGIPTCCGYSACAAADKIATPSATYLGLSTALGQSGTWSANLGVGNYPNATLAKDWPYGVGDYDYAYWAPLLVNKAGTSWGTSSTDWKLNAEIILGETLLWLGLRNDNNAQAYYGILAAKMFKEFKEALKNKWTVVAPHKEAEDLGFPGKTVAYEGMVVGTEAGCPENKGFITNIETTELCILGKDFITTKGPFELQEGGYGFKAFTFGNTYFQPPQVAMIADFTS